MKCFRRRSISFGKCDTNSSGVDTFVNKHAQLPANSAAVVASLAMYAVGHWALASTQQKVMATALVPENFGDFLGGVLEGLLSDGDDLSKCTVELPVVASALKKAATTVAAAVGKAIVAAKEAATSCVVVLQDGVKLAGSIFKDIRHPQQIVSNINATQFDFLTDLGDGLEALGRDDFPTAGTLMGMALRRALEGDTATPLTVII